MQLSCPVPFLLLILFEAIHPSSGACRDLEVNGRTLSDSFQAQPLYLMFTAKTENNEQLDNVCYTLFTLPDNNHTFTVYYSRVYRNGTGEVQTVIASQVGPGVQRTATRSNTLLNYSLGPAGCGTNVFYNCNEIGDGPSYGAGSSTSRMRLSKECLRRAEEILEGQGITGEYVILPMERASRCILEQNGYLQQNQL